MAAISGLYGTTSVDTLVNSYLEIERKPVNKLEDTKDNYKKQLNVFSDFRAELTALRDRVKGFLAVGSESKLGTKRAVSSNASLVTADASSTAAAGIHTIFISRIAGRDTVLSDRINANQNKLSKSFENKSLQFRIQTGDNDPVEISVTFGGSSEDNEDAINRIADAINNADVDVTANVIKVDRNNVRLSIVSNETGSSSSITLSGGDDSKLLKELGLDFDDDERDVASNNSGGYIIEDAGNLDALFTLNGVEITQESNSVSDIINGLDITLLKANDADDQPETITVEYDGEELKQEIRSFIEDYNSSLQYITAKSGIDTETGTRRTFSGNYAVRNLQLKMREIVSGFIEAGNNDNVKNLAQIGITAERDGTLKINDEDLFDSQISDYAVEVGQIFTAEDVGIARRLDAELTRFTRFGGVISDYESGLNRQIDNADKRIKTLNDRLQVYEESLRNKYAGLQKLMYSLSSQQTMLQSINQTFSLYNTGLTSQQQIGTYFSSGF